MKRLHIALVIGVIAWQAWGAYQTRHGGEELLDDSESSEIAQLLDQEAASDKRRPDVPPLLSIGSLESRTLLRSARPRHGALLRALRKISSSAHIMGCCRGRSWAEGTAG